MSRARIEEVREKWCSVLSRFADCQMTVSEFCELEGISESNFYRWKRRLRGAHRAARTQPASADRLLGGDSAVGGVGRMPAFVPLRVLAPDSEPTQLRLPGGAVVELAASLSRERLIELLAATVAATNHDSDISNLAADVTNASQAESWSC